jgi:hypothetical protein
VDNAQPTIKNFGTITQKKADDVLHLISPPPGLPRQGAGVITSLPGWEGLREGDKMTFTFFWVIDQKNFCNVRVNRNLRTSESRTLNP